MLLLMAAMLSDAARGERAMPPRESLQRFTRCCRQSACAPLYHITRRSDDHDKESATYLHVTNIAAVLMPILRAYAMRATAQFCFVMRAVVCFQRRRFAICCAMICAAQRAMRMIRSSITDTTLCTRLNASLSALRLYARCRVILLRYAHESLNVMFVARYVVMRRASYDECAEQAADDHDQHYH